MLTPLGATTRAGCPTANAVPGIGVGVKVAVGSGVGVSVKTGRIGVDAVTGPPDGPVGATVASPVTVNGVGVGVGRSAKLPQANVGASQISETASKARNCQRRLNRGRKFVGVSSMFIACDYTLSMRCWLSCERVTSGVHCLTAHPAPITA